MARQRCFLLRLNTMESEWASDGSRSANICHEFRPAARGEDPLAFVGCPQHPRLSWMRKLHPDHARTRLIAVPDEGSPDVARSPDGRG